MRGVTKLGGQVTIQGTRKAISGRQGLAYAGPLQRSDLIVLPPDFLERFGSRNHLPLPPLATLLDRHRLDEPLVTTLLSEKKPITNKKQKEGEPEESWA